MPSSLIIVPMSKRLILVFILLCAVWTVALCQESASDQAETAQEPVVPQEKALERVTAIEVSGNTSVSSNTVISKMKTRVGGPYQEGVLSDDLKRLYLLGFFDDIKIDTERSESGIKVIVKVVERPVIEKIIFKGIHRLRSTEEKLKTTLQSKEGQYLDNPSLEEDARTLKKQYERIGYSEAAISHSEARDPATGKVTVTFTVTEGVRQRIERIYVEGNIAFSDARILKIMKTKRAWLFNPGVLKDEVLEEDIERVKAFYRSNGYSDVAVEYEMQRTAAARFIHITIRITEGKRYLVGSIRITGNRDVMEDDIRKALKECVPDKVFSDEKMKVDVSAIQGVYFDRGYIFAQVDEATSIDPDTGRVDILYTIAENEIAYVDKIKIRGNIKTKDIVVRRELRILPGERFDGEKLRRSKERLQNLGFFEEVSYSTEEGSESTKKDLVVEVKEAKTGSFSFGGGYSTVDQLIGFVELEQKNFDWRNWPYFTGAGQDLKLRASFGSISSGYYLSFTEPWLFDYPVSFGFDVYKQTHERESDVGYGYDEDITGGTIRLGKELSEFVKANLQYRYDTIDISNVTDTATNDLKKEAGENAISSMQLGLSFDNRDNVFEPVKGTFLTGSVETAGGLFGGDKDFIKYFGRASQYFPLPRNSSLEVRLRVGIADPYGDSQTVPIYERYFAGGANTIRGYDERSIGPIDPSSKDPLGGESMVVGNIEYTYPLLDFLKVACFYDTGNVWEKVGDVGEGGFKSGFGLGVRIKTPIGPIMLDYGIPLDTAPGEEDKGSGKFHFSMSHGF